MWLNDPSQIHRTALNTLEITRPLSGTRYLSQGELTIAYWSDLPYDRVEYRLNGRVLQNGKIDLSRLSIGRHEASVELFNTS